MQNKKICITTDCVCDLPEELLKRYNIELVYFYIETDYGRFRDRDEITAQNIFEYLLNNGNKTLTKAPPTEEFKAFFEKKLKEYDEVIHIAISSKLSLCVDNCLKAAGQLGEDGKRVHVFDSRHLSTGLGLLVLHAARLAEEGVDVTTIIKELETMRVKVSTTFMARNADYLYRNGKVNRGVMKLCKLFNIHPVLTMRDGLIKIKSFKIGDYQRSAIRYMRQELEHKEKIQKDRIFITHAGCSVSEMRLFSRTVKDYGYFEEVIVTNASATISGNCGPGTFGLLFVCEER